MPKPQYNEVRMFGDDSVRISVLKKPCLKKLTMRYMRKHQPFDTLPPEYFACAWRPSDPPMFIYGFPFLYDGDFDASIDFCWTIELDGNS
ncbi:hypothetical protein C8R45DRAFT_1106334 [Mycena sanguinolenta]|nr:hypothetical protein C8R45DRAFT_1106334 [Mycena sanguinolenta]